MILNKVKITPRIPEPITLHTENPAGLRFAVVYQDTHVLALFDSEYWAEQFVSKVTINKDSFGIYLVKDCN